MWTPSGPGRQSAVAVEGPSTPARWLLTGKDSPRAVAAWSPARCWDRVRNSPSTQALPSALKATCLRGGDREV